MKLSGIEIRNFRSIGNDPIVLNPMKKCNLLVGQNNSGKSNVLKAIKWLSDRLQPNATRITLGELDWHRRSADNPFFSKLWFRADLSIPSDVKFSNMMHTDTFWIELSWNKDQVQRISDSIFTQVTDFDISNGLIGYFLNEQWSRRVEPNEISSKLQSILDKAYRPFDGAMPPVVLIGEFRQIRTTGQYSVDGGNLIELLAEYQIPVIGRDADQQRFEEIQEFMRKLLDLPKAKLEIPLGKTTVIVNNDGLRLPLSSYGTGVHELLIMVTAVLSLENTICCIEEPEIHLHPRLQRQLISFLLEHSSNVFILTSHSPTLIDASSADEIQLIHLTTHSGATMGRVVNRPAHITSALSDLGMKASDLLQANCIIWVEGPSDAIYVRIWLRFLAPDLIEGRHFTFMSYKELSRLSITDEVANDPGPDVLRINRNVVMIADSDKKAEGEDLPSWKQKYKRLCENAGGICLITDGREIENYIPSAVISRALNDMRGKMIDVSTSKYIDFCDAVDSAMKAAGLEPLRYSSSKLNYSRKFAEHFLAEDIDNEIKDFLNPAILKIREWSR